MGEQQTPLDDALECIREIIDNNNRLRMSIPADPARDHDLRISTAVDWARKRIAELEREKAEALRLRSFDEWSEDHGCGLWWREPVSEPPYAGAPGDSDWPWPKKDSAKLVWIPCPNPSSDRRATEDVPGD